jgi:hypothetical protein
MESALRAFPTRPAHVVFAPAKPAIQSRSNSESILDREPRYPLLPHSAPDMWNHEHAHNPP